jgi:hypothetical protein
MLTNLVVTIKIIKEIKKQKASTNEVKGLRNKLFDSF